MFVMVEDRLTKMGELRPGSWKAESKESREGKTRCWYGSKPWAQRQKSRMRRTTEGQAGQACTWRTGPGRPPDPAHCPPVMEVWCRKRIPVEGNFGQTYDTLNQSIRDLDGEFSANIDFKVEGKGEGWWGVDREWEEGIRE